METNIIIGADIVPTHSNQELFVGGKGTELVGKGIEAILHEADYIIMNLEVPLTDKESPIIKCGPCLRAPTSVIKGLRELNPYFYSLSNNHILDQGIQGLKSTMSILQKNNISFSGVGKNLLDAKKPFIFNLNNKVIGIYCCAEHEFSIATEETYGANPFDPLESFDDIKDLKRKADIIIVLYHGGKEHYRYPSPRLQKIFRKFADVGADCIIAQHTHCIGCYERYHDSMLIYGQGNFLFDGMENEYWKTSILVNMTIDSDNIEYHFIPIIKEKERIRIANKTEREKIIKDIDERSLKIMDTSFVKKNYETYSLSMWKEYLFRLSAGFSRLFPVRVTNKISRYKFLDRMYKKEYLTSIENLFECESHRELFIVATKMMKKERFL